MILFEKKTKKQKNCRNNSKIKYQNRRKEPKLIPPKVHALSWLDKGPTIKKNGVVKIVLWAHTYHLSEQNSVKQFPKNNTNDSTHFCNVRVEHNPPTNI